MKTCYSCHALKEDSEFDHRPDRPGTLRSRCKECRRAYLNERYDRLRRKPKRDIHAPKACSLCGRTKPMSAFVVDRQARDGHKSNCRACENKRARTARK